MTQEEVAAATATPIGAVGRSFYRADAVTEAMSAAGFGGLPLYVGGRGGVAGDVADDDPLQWENSLFVRRHERLPLDISWN